MSKRNRRGALGQATPTSCLQPTRSLGPPVELGDRVQCRNATDVIAYGAWGTVIRNGGFGMVRVRLDDGRLLWMRTAHLQFEKYGHPRLEPV